MAYLGVDIGGTFTDMVHLADDGSVTSTKVSSTPPDFERGFLQQMRDLPLREDAGAGAAQVAAIMPHAAAALRRLPELTVTMAYQAW